MDYFIDLHNQWSCYATEDLENMSPLSISAKFIDDPSEFGTWPKFDMDASKRANVAVYEALQGHGESGYGDLTLYPQNTNLPGTALGSFALRGSAVALFESSSQTQYDGMKRNGMLRKQIEIGLGGLVDAVAMAPSRPLTRRSTTRSAARLPAGGLSSGQTGSGAAQELGRGSAVRKVGSTSPPLPVRRAVGGRHLPGGRGV